MKLFSANKFFLEKFHTWKGDFELHYKDNMWKGKIKFLSGKSDELIVGEG